MLSSLQLFLRFDGGKFAVSSGDRGSEAEIGYTMRLTGRGGGCDIFVILFSVYIMTGFFGGGGDNYFGGGSATLITFADVISCRRHFISI